MAKILKIVGIVLGGAVVLVIVAAVLAALLIDPNDYRDDIEALVERRTGRSLAIEGELDVSVFPWLGLEIGEVSLGNAAGFEGPFVRVAAAQARVRLLPLIGGEVRMGTLVLEGLRLDLAVDAKGRANWADLGARGEAAPAEEKEPAPAGRGAAGLAALGGVRVSDAAIRYTDRQAGRAYRVEELDLRTGRLRPGEPFDLRLATGYAVEQPSLDGRLEVEAEVEVDRALRRVKVRDLQLEARAQGEALPEALTARLETPALDVDLEAQTAQLRQAVLEAEGVSVRTSLEGKGLLERPTLTGPVTVERFSPRALLERLGQPLPQTSDPDVLDRASARFDLTASPAAARLEDLELTLDQTTVKGSFAVPDIAGPSLAFDLHADRLDLDAYLPPQAEGGAGGGSPGAAAGAGATQLPVEMLRGLDVDGRLRIDWLRAYQIRSEDVEVEISGKDGALRVHPARARLYEGRYQGDIRIDARGERPQVSMDERLTGVQVGGLVHDLTGQDRLSGTAQGRATLSASGRTVEALRRSLDGELAFELTDGAVKGINMAHLIRAAQARLEGRAPPPAAAEQTDFTELRASARVREGVVHDALEGKSPLLRVDGEGRVDLVRQRVDYRLKAVVVGTLEGQGGRALAELKGVPIPVRVSGPFADPKIELDLAAAITEAQKQKLEKKLEQKLQEELGGDTAKEREPEEQIKRRLEDEVQKGLEKLFR